MILYKKNVARQFLLFNAFGLVASIVQIYSYAIFNKSHFYYLISSALSYWLAASVGFIFNYRITFNTPDKVSKRNLYYKYIAVSLFGSLIDVFLVFILAELIFSSNANGKIISKVISIIILAIVAFYLHKHFTFKFSKSESIN